MTATVPQGAELRPDDPGRIGRYRLLRRLGEGGMGVVYLGASPAGRAVAIKVVRPELAGNPDFRARFRGEVEAARKVGGAFTSPVVEADPGGPVPWLATAYVNGLSLKDTVARYGPMPEPLLRTLGAGLGEALIAIHAAGLLHRDLKPANILLAKDGPKVIDFGISKAAESTTLTAEGQFIGSPGYMSPEQIRGGELTPASDVFAYGAVLAFAATGRPPFGKGAVPTVVHRTLHEDPDLRGVPASLAQMVAACLSRDPDRRPPVRLLPSLPAARPPEPGWLPGGLGEELRNREETLVLDLREHARTLTRRRLLIGGAAVAGLAAIGGGTAAALALTQEGKDGGTPAPKALWRTTIERRSERLLRVLPNSVVVSVEKFSEDEIRRHSLTDGRQTWVRVGQAAFDSRLMYMVDGAGEQVVAMDEFLKDQWSYDLPSGFRFPEVRVRDGSVFLSGGQTLIGLDAATGRERWRREWPGTAGALILGVQGRTLVGRADDEEGDHLHFGLDVATGADRWSERRGGLLLAPGEGELIFRNSSRTTLDALSLGSGKKVWSAALPGAVSPDDEDAPLLDGVWTANGLVYVNGPTIYALDPGTGRERWTYTPSARGEHGFRVEGRYLYVLETPRLVALDARTGRRLWSVDTPASRLVPLFPAGELICLGVSGPENSGLYGWEAGTGRLVWNHRVPTSAADGFWIFAHEGRVLAAAHGDQLHAFRLG